MHNSLYLLDPWDSSNYRGMCIQDNAADFAGTMDSTVAAAEEPQSLSLLSETDWPRQTSIQKEKQYFYRGKRGTDF